MPTEPEINTTAACLPAPRGVLPILPAEMDGLDAKRPTGIAPPPPPVSGAIIMGDAEAGASASGAPSMLAIPPPAVPPLSMPSSVLGGAPAKVAVGGPAKAVIPLPPGPAGSTAATLPPLPKAPKTVYPVPITRAKPPPPAPGVGDTVMVEWKRYDWRVCKILRTRGEDKGAMYFVHYMECEFPACPKVHPRCPARTVLVFHGRLPHVCHHLARYARLTLGCRHPSCYPS